MLWHKLLRIYILDGRQLAHLGSICQPLVVRGYMLCLPAQCEIVDADCVHLGEIPAQRTHDIAIRQSYLLRNSQETSSPALAHHFESSNSLADPATEINLVCHKMHVFLGCHRPQTSLGSGSLVCATAWVGVIPTRVFLREPLSGHTFDRFAVVSSWP